VVLGAQDLWYKTYLDAKAAYDRRDFATAEQKFFASMSQPGAPREHGPGVLLVSQQRGFMPEYYLALIYADRQQWVDVVRYATLAERYRDLSPQLRDPIVKARAAATKALETPARGSGSNPDADALFKNAQAAATAGRFDDARTAASQALAKGASASSIELLRQVIDDQEFDAVLSDAAKSRDDGRLPAARAAVARLRALNVGAARKSLIDPLATSIDHRETYAAAMAEARQFAGNNRWTDARTSAERASALGVNDAEARAFATEAGRQETFAALLATAKQAFDANRLSDARAAVVSAKALRIDSGQLDDLDAKITIRDLSGRIDTMVAAGTVQGLSPLVEQLAAVSPRDPAIAKAQTFIAGHLGEAAKERLGLSEFFRGRYESAAGTLAQIDDKDRPRARLYLACAQAALALVESDDKRKKQLESDARQTLNSVRARVGRLTPDDLRFVSPSILHLLQLDAGR
jgi:hypothetical protein